MLMHCTKLCTGGAVGFFFPQKLNSSLIFDCSSSPGCDSSEPGGAGADPALSGRQHSRYFPSEYKDIRKRAGQEPALHTTGPDLSNPPIAPTVPLQTPKDLKATRGRPPNAKYAPYPQRKAPARTITHKLAWEMATTRLLRDLARPYWSQ